MLRSIRNVKLLKCVSLKCLSPLFVFYSSLNYDGPRTKAFMVHIYFTQRNLLLNSKQQKKMIGHHTRLRGNNDLPLWRGPAVKKKPPFF